MKELIKILFVEDVLTDAELNWHEIEKSGIVFDKLLVDTRKGFLEGLKSFIPDIIISDYSLPQFDGMSALLLRNELAPLIPFILVTGSINEEVAVECMRSGADDYILKERISRLGIAVNNSLEKVKLLKEKKNAEEKLRKSELRLQKAQSIAHVGNWELNLSDRMFLCSDEAVRIYGFIEGINEFPQDIVQKIPLPEFRPALDEALDRLLIYNEPYDVEFNIKRAKDNAIRTVYSKAEIIQEPGTGQIKVVGVIQDITERKWAAEELRKSQQIIEGILNAIPIRVFWKDKNLVYLGCNNVFACDSGFDDPKDIIGKNDYQMGWSKNADSYRKDDLQVIESGIPKLHIEESQFTPEGKQISLLTSKLPLRGSNMEITGVLGTYIDITDRKIIEEELILAKNKAEEGDKLKTAFLHNISHEIRTPMNAIVGFSALMGEPDLDAKSRGEYIEVIVQSSNHLLEIITDIVDISNIEANLVKVVEKEININSTLKSLYNQFIPKANEKKIKLIFETALSDSEALILTDSTKLNQILINLISNALKFTTDGSIKISYKVKNTFMEFCIKDTGIGIAEEYHSKIFERFYQVLHSFSKLYEGTGLGLAISKANVELMGGKIWLSSEPGSGSSFYFTIPYEKRFSVPQKDISKSPKEYKAFTEKKKILIAEDIESNFKLICYFLSGSNTEIIRAVNGKEAVEKCLLDKDIDLILMDIKMPVMDGYTAIKLIRETNSLIPIIAQTAYFDDKDSALLAGSSGFISKPFDKKGLLKIVHEFI